MKKYDDLGTYSTLVFTSPNCWTSSAWMLEESEKKKSPFYKKFFGWKFWLKMQKKKKVQVTIFFFFWMLISSTWKRLENLQRGIFKLRFLYDAKGEKSWISEC